MSDEHAVTIERLRQQQTARQARHAPPPASTLLPAVNLPADLQVGSRVFDTVSGEEGEVVHGTAQNIIGATPQR